MALGLGTMVGWKRIVVTIGEKIGKDHLISGQGAAAENYRDGDHRHGGLVRSSGEYDPPAPWRHITPRSSGAQCATCFWPGR